MRATIDDAQIHSVPREFGRGGESDRTGADDQNLLHRRSTLRLHCASFGRSTGRSLCSKADARQKEGRRPMEWTTARPLSSRGRGKRTAHRSIRGGQPLRACRTATSVDGGRHRPDCASISTVRATGVPAPCGVRVLPSLPRCRGWCSRGRVTKQPAWSLGHPRPARWQRRCWKARREPPPKRHAPLDGLRGLRFPC